MAKGWVKRKAKAKAKKVWSSYRKNAKVNKKARKEYWREQRLTAKQEKSTGSFWSRHPLIADIRDWTSVQSHQFFDKRDLRGGIITSDEFDKFSDYDSKEEWLRDMLAQRREVLLRQAARRRDEDVRAPLTMVYASGHQKIAAVKHVGFRPPAPRPVSKPSLKPSWTPPTSRPVRRKRKNRVGALVNKWQPQLTQNARTAMAADADLSGALQSLNNFAEQFPETRTQIHESLGKMAEFGKGFSAAMESYRSTLAQGKGEDNPGLPPEVLAHIQPLESVGEEIVAACQATLAAWEDYFADAIKVAQDEHTPSKQALTS